MQEVTCHQVSAERMALALDDVEGRAFGWWHGMQYDSFRLKKLRGMRDELLDHVAARAPEEPALDSASRTVLRTAAECSRGLLDLGCWPNGDQEIVFALVRERISSDDKAFVDVIDEAPTAATWIETFEMCVSSGLVWEWRRAIGVSLRDENAPAIRDGVPYSKHDSVSDPVDLAAMDALCGYLTPERGHLPRDWPTVTLRKPDADEHAEAARRLDAAGTLTPDRHLLRVLLDDDQNAFEQALAARLIEHRENAGSDPDPAPRTLLPLGAITLAGLAVQAHGWELGVRSGYLPSGMLGSPDALRRAPEQNDLGYWTAGSPG
ncbi:immunity 49 family protein [Nocardiopsis sediminis]|uniref:Immunity 49 family protein n=1 Tax=Nocardiopsis sediminis TaxID=1778267 RepID=A0ABV8FK31_9ACTN